MEEFTAQNRADRVKRFVEQFHQNNTLIKPNLASVEQLEAAERLASAISAYDFARQEVESTKVFDQFAVSGKEVRLFHATIECDKCIIRAKALGMIPPSEDKLVECEKNKDAMEKLLHELEGQRADLESKLNLARQRITDLESLARLHGIDPTPRRDTFEGAVE